MFKKLLTLALLTFSIQTVLAEADVKYYGVFVLGYWGAKEYNFTYDRTIVMDKNFLPVDTIWGKDPNPVNVTAIIPAGYLGTKVNIGNINFVLELGVKRALYDFGYSYHATFGNFFIYRYKTFARIRQFYGEWNINDNLSMIIGSHFTPCNFTTISNQAFYAYNGFTNTGVLEEQERPLIQLQAKTNSEKSFNITGKLAVIAPDTSTIFLPYFSFDQITHNDTAKAIVTRNEKPMGEGDFGNYKLSIKIPKIELNTTLWFEKKILAAHLGLAGGYQKYDILYKPKFTDTIFNPNATSTTQAPLEAYVLASFLDFKVGPVTLAYSCAGGKNLGTYGITIGQQFSYRGTTGAGANIFYAEPRDELFRLKTTTLEPGDTVTMQYLKDLDVDRKINNSNSFEMAFVAKVKPKDFLSFEAGYGFVTARHEVKDQKELWKSTWHDISAWYAQIELTIAKKVLFTPEVGQYLYGPLRSQGKFTYWGLSAAITF